MLTALVVLTAVLAAASVLLAVRVRGLRQRVLWLEGTLDAVPQPITVTDLDMKWVFVNHTTETLLQKSREQVRGRHCSEWGAMICGTDKCGIRSLRSGCPKTNYLQNMPDGSQRYMQVDTSYIKARSGENMGHVEIVTDIHAKYELEGLHARIASSLEEMSSAMSEIDAQARSNSDHAEQAAALAAEALSKTRLGSDSVNRLATMIRDVAAHSKKIISITKMIDEIAFQTNLLSLNAAIEAARAGDVGRGFSVVADEVRSLAQRVSVAAKETEDLINQTVQAIANGDLMAGEVTESIDEIAGTAQRVTDLVSSIARASGEQTQGISAMTQGLTDLETTTLNAAATHSQHSQH